MKIIVNVILLIFLFTCHIVAASNLVETLKQIKPSIVGIGLHTPTGRQKNVLSGSGFIVDDGLTVVTNSHVLPEKLDESLLQKIAVFVGSGKTAKVRFASVVARSTEHDLAILKIHDDPLPAMKLASEDLIDEGYSIAFTGFPIGAVLGLYPVTHRGIIAAITPTVIPAADSRQINLKMLKRMRNPYLVYQLDATAYPGNSGSAMYDENNGEVLGVINKVFVQDTKEGVLAKPSGITYAIPVKYVHHLLKKVKNN